MARPWWLEEAVKAAAAVAGNVQVRRGSGRERPVVVGPARPDSERGEGWFQIALRRTSYDADRTVEQFLAPEGSHGEECRYSLRESLLDGGLLRVRVADHVDREDLVLYIRRDRGTDLDRALLDGLRELTPGPLTKAFAEGELAPVTVRSGPAGFNAGQEAAWSAGTSPGLNLVWGPPGTGKTQVIGRIVEELVRRGRTVLMVSGTNVAVDNAIQRAARYADPRPGVMVRVGTPHVPKVADDPRICLDRLLEAGLAELDRRAEAISEEIVLLRADESVVELADAEERLNGYDSAAYAAARRRLDDERRRMELMRECQVIVMETANARSDAKRRKEVMAEAEASARVAGHSRECHEEARLLRQELDGHVLDLNRAKARVSELLAERQDLQDQIRNCRGILKTRQRQRLEEEALHVQRRLSQAAARAEDLDRLLRESGPELERRIAVKLAEARHTPQEVASISRRAEQAAQRFEEAEKLAAEREARRAELERRLNRPVEPPTAQDRALVSRVENEGLPALHERLPRLRAVASRVTARISKLEKEHEKVLADRRKAGQDAGRRLIEEARVVATTHARLRLTKGLSKRTFDYVLIDEAAASTPLEILYALGRGREGAVLLGDFKQLNAVISEEHRNIGDPAVEKWLRSCPYALLGVTDSAQAESRRGCVALNVQYRFGRRIMELANRLAYGGMLRASTGQEDEIVLLDVDGLGEELAGIRREGNSATWPIGALLAKALAEHHVIDDRESAVGVISPYRKQAELIEGYFADSGTSPCAEVGTVHRFQGREFDTVVLDLVDRGDGWVAGGAVSALKLLTVGVTRARHRLYVIVDGAAVERARTGPFRVLRDLRASGVVEVVPAASLLGPETDAPAGSRVMRELREALGRYAKVIEVYDEERLPDELARRIDEAEESVWLWSPWVGARSRKFVPLLAQAQERGVKVRVVVRDDRTMNNHRKKGEAAQDAGQYTRYVQELLDQIRHVVRLRAEHQKIVVIDGRLVFLGSMNTLSHPGSSGPRETMALFDSRSFAEHILRHERADELGRPRKCRRCGRQGEVRLSGKGRSRGLHWFCTGGSQAHPEWEEAFSPLPGGRNDRRH